MRHHDKHKKFGRKSGPRKGLLRSLVLSLIRDGKIETTETRAKAIRPLIEKLVTEGRGGAIASKRLVRGRLGNNTKGMVMLAKDIAPRYKDRKGGYTRIIKSRRRASDGSQLAVIEFVK